MKSIIKLFACISLIAVLALNSFSQNWNSYTKESTSNELCSDQINCIIIDHENNKWFGTDKGISMFNGENWTTYDSTNVLLDNNISSSAIDNEGILWFGTNMGSVVKYDGQEWTIFNSKSQLPGDIILSIAVDKQNNKWFGANSSHLTCYDNKQWIQNDIIDMKGYSPDAYDIKAIAFDSENRKWLGYTSCDWGHVINFDAEFHYYACTEDLISCITIDKNDNVWVGSAFGIVKYKNDQTELFENINGHTWSHVSSIFIDENNNKWIGTFDGLALFDDHQWTNYNTENGLAGNFINAITLDHEGNLWIGTNSGISVSKIINTKVDENSMFSNPLILYPNPAHDNLNLNLSLQSCDNIMIKLVNQSGQVSYVEDFESYQKDVKVSIDVSNFIKGIYMVQVIAGDKTVSKKVEIY